MKTTEKAKTFGCAWPSIKLLRGDHAKVTPIPPPPQHMVEYRRDISTRHDLNMDCYEYDKQFRQEREKSLCKWNVQRPDLHMTYSQPLQPNSE